MKEENTPIKEFQKRIGVSLVVKRIPKPTLDTFKEVSNKEFAGDYGMYIKFLQDIYLGIVPKGWEHLEVALNDLNIRLNKLETKPKVRDTSKDIKMGDGRIIKRDQEEQKNERRED